MAANHGKYTFLQAWGTTPLLFPNVRKILYVISTFSTVRHRQRQTKGCGSVKATISLAFKLSKEAEKHWRKIQGYELILKVLSGIKFVDGKEEQVA